MTRLLAGSNRRQIDRAARALVDVRQKRLDSARDEAPRPVVLVRCRCCGHTHSHPDHLDERGVCAVCVDVVDADDLDALLGGKP